MYRPKQKPMKSQKLRDAANGQSCVVCGAEDGTIVLCHRNVPGHFGMDMKGPDFWAAWLCVWCHKLGDTEKRRDYQWWEIAVLKTQERLFEAGILVVK